MYRPDCPGYGGPASPAASVPVVSPPSTGDVPVIVTPPVVVSPPTEVEDCPTPVPNDGMWRPNCPGYGGRRDVIDNLSEREVSQLADLTPLINSLIKQITAYLQSPAMTAPAVSPAVVANSTVAASGSDNTAARVMIAKQRDELLGADGLDLGRRSDIDLSQITALLQLLSPAIHQERRQEPATVNSGNAGGTNATATIQQSNNQGGINVGVSVLDNLLSGLLSGGGGLLGGGLLRTTVPAAGAAVQKQSAVKPTLPAVDKKAVDQLSALLVESLRTALVKAQAAPAVAVAASTSASASA
jgi:hypothetical protein